MSCLATAKFHGREGEQAAERSRADCEAPPIMLHVESGARILMLSTWNRTVCIPLLSLSLFAGCGPHQNLSITVKGQSAHRHFDSSRVVAKFDGRVVRIYAERNAATGGVLYEPSLINEAKSKLVIVAQMNTESGDIWFAVRGTGAYNGVFACQVRAPDASSWWESADGRIHISLVATVPPGVIHENLAEPVYNDLTNVTLNVRMEATAVFNPAEYSAKMENARKAFSGYEHPIIERLITRQD